MNAPEPGQLVTQQARTYHVAYVAEGAPGATSWRTLGVRLDAAGNMLHDDIGRLRALTLMADPSTGGYAVIRNDAAARQASGFLHPAACALDDMEGDAAAELTNLLFDELHARENDDDPPDSPSLQDTHPAAGHMLGYGQ